MAFYVYILKCSDGSYYTGHTDDIDARISAHSLGIIKCYTYTRRPAEVAYVSEFGARDEAFNADPSTSSGGAEWGLTRKKKRALINGEFYLLKYLARSKK